MGKRGVGALFCLTAGILFSARYIAAAILMSGILSKSTDLFSAGLEYVGTTLTTLSIISLIVGVCYLIWAEVSGKTKKHDA